MSLANPSRRLFLGTSMAAAAATSLDPLGRQGPDDEVRIGLIGCGGRGTGAANQALQTLGNARLVAVGDAFKPRIDSALKKLGEWKLGARHGEEKPLSTRIDVPESRRHVGVDAFEKVIAEDVDVVILATPPHFRPAHFEAAVAANKHVFMEKPVGVDGAGIRKVLAAGKAAEEKNLKVVVGLQRHYQPGYLAALEQVRSGMIGKIVAAHCYWNMGSLWHEDRKSSMSDLEWQMKNWLYFTWLSGDHIVEQHVHNLDVVNWFVGAYPTKAHGLGGRQVRTEDRFGHIYDHHAVHYEYPDGTFLSSHCRQIAGCRNEVAEHLIGSEGRANLSAGRWSITRHDGKRWRWTGKNENPYQVEHDRLFAAIREDLPLNDTHHGAMSTLTAIMGRMATYTGQEITEEAALNDPNPLGPPNYDFGQKLAMPPVPQPGS